MRYPCSKNKSENIGYKFIVIVILRYSSMSFISLDRGRTRLLFDVLFVRLP